MDGRLEVHDVAYYEIPKWIAGAVVASVVGLIVLWIWWGKRRRPNLMRGEQMYERFTDRARKVMRLASDEARESKRGFVDTEHLLLGLAKEGGGVASHILKELGADPARMRIEIEKLVKASLTSVDEGKQPESDQLKQVIENAWKESRKHPDGDRLKRIIEDVWEEARKLPESGRLKQVVVFSMEEARNLNHNYVGTEHLLLGLLREQEGVAAQVLTTLGLRLDDVRQEVLNLLGYGLS
jgi:ATP-dependent Clp protease ATP-binding subunit ClpC